MKLLTCFFCVAILILVSCSDSTTNRAYTLMEVGSFTEAHDILTEAIKKNPDDKNLYLARADCYANARIAIDLGRKGIDKITKHELSEKAISEYEKALKFDNSYTQAHLHLIDFRIYLREDENKYRDSFNKLIVMKVNAADPYMLYYYEDNHLEQMRTYFKALSSNQTLSYLPDKATETIIILSDCSTTVRAPDNATSTELLTKYDIFDQASLQSDKEIKFLYDRQERLGDEETLYKYSFYEFISYAGRRGLTRKKFYMKNFNWEHKLYRRALTKREINILTNFPENYYSLNNVFMLFTGKYWGNVGFLKRNPENVLSKSLKYTSKSNYREITESGSSTIIKVRGIGTAHGRPSEIHMQPVKAKKYLNTVDRFALVKRNEVTFGIGDYHVDVRRGRIIKHAKFLDDETKKDLISGKFYKGTPFVTVNALLDHSMQLVEKIYRQDECWSKYSSELFGLSDICFSNESLVSLLKSQNK